ncbi:10218_t:CDS:2, partial [Dentiscutata heterogama]
FVVRSSTPINNKTWENWNGAINISPDAIFEPSTLEELINIVKLAKENNKTIRCAAQGHSVSSLSVTEHYLVVVTNLTQVTVQEHPKYGWTVTAEAGISLADLDEALRNHNPPLTLESAVVYNTVRVSGVIATGSHGATTSSGNMPDQICSMKIVTGSGEVSEFSEEINKSEFNAAKVNLGLLGIIYSVTFRVKPMYNLRMNDVYISVNEWLKPHIIKNIVESSDGIEIFYIPFNGFNLSEPKPLDPNRDLVWVKNWVRTDEPASFTQQQIQKTRELQSQGLIQQFQFISSILQTSKKIPDAIAMTWSALINGGNTSFVYQAPDAIHYAASEESLNLDLVEYGFKIDPDFSNVATEFSYLVQSIYEFAVQGKFPVNYVAEFRIIKSSEALLSNNFDHDPEALYCQLDVVTVRDTPDWKEWVQLIGQRLFDKYRARPHWAKNWNLHPNVNLYLSDILSDQIKQFEKVRAKYDPDKIFFDNQSLQDIFSRVLGPQK